RWPESSVYDRDQTAGEGVSHLSSPQGLQSWLPWYRRARGRLWVRCGRLSAKARGLSPTPINARCWTTPTHWQPVTKGLRSNDYSIEPKRPVRQSSLALPNSRVTRRRAVSIYVRQYESKHHAGVAARNPTSAQFAAGAVPSRIPARS